MLGEMNRLLMHEEGHRKLLTTQELVTRMWNWISSKEYTAVIFEDSGRVVAYALYREKQESIELKQFFVTYTQRKGAAGQIAMQMLFYNIFPKHKKVVLKVATNNPAIIAFWKSVGFEISAMDMEFSSKK